MSKLLTSMAVGATGTIAMALVIAAMVLSVFVFFELVLLLLLWNIKI